MPQSPFSIKNMLSVLKTIFLYRGADRDIRFALVRALFKANRIIKTDMRNNNCQIHHMAARVPSKSAAMKLRDALLEGFFESS
jgi:hypothetical protein